MFHVTFLFFFCRYIYIYLWNYSTRIETKSQLINSTIQLVILKQKNKQEKKSVYRANLPSLFVCSIIRFTFAICVEWRTKFPHRMNSSFSLSSICNQMSRLTNRSYCAIFPRLELDSIRIRKRNFYKFHNI